MYNSHYFATFVMLIQRIVIPESNLYILLSTQYLLIYIQIIFKHSLATNTSDCSVQIPRYATVIPNNILSFLPPAKYTGLSSAAYKQKRILKKIRI